MTERDAQLAHQLRQIVVRLDLMSHASGAAYEFAPSETGRARVERWRSSDRHDPVPHMGSRHNPAAYDTRKPSGALDWQGDRIPEYRQKSAEYFRRRARQVRNVMQLEALLAEAIAAEEAWRKTPLLEGERPASKADPRWKQWVGSSKLENAEIARLYSVSRQYIHKIRRQYGEP